MYPHCTDCARRLGTHCIAMRGWHDPCWAYTTDYAQVARELAEAVAYLRLRGADTDETKTLLRMMQRRAERAASA